ncbi:cysteinyl-tRNA synthetase-like protein [Trifolium pratense]|uniref:Cysteinyl-tRNA synthetase-like protein n=1 Tax=Trifolium pratense TaxID=57577 RepID=A0A2K3MM47_TRIPR|nr:cysteinyl-tRNA synthetase-like protein [Trifolium pratense]
MHLFVVLIVDVVYMCIDSYVCLQTLYECEILLNQHDQTVRKDAVPSDTLNIIDIDNLYDVFLTSMSDDLHTPVVLAGLSDPLKSINDLLHTHKGKKQQFRIESLAALKKSIGDVLTVLGLMPSSYYEISTPELRIDSAIRHPTNFSKFLFNTGVALVLQQLKEKALKHANVTEDEILQKIEERATARIQKKYAKSNAIRKDLAVVGIALMDSPNETTWRPSITLPLQEQL